jgi:hypothetical protein
MLQNISIRSGRPIIRPLQPDEDRMWWSVSETYL